MYERHLLRKDGNPLFSHPPQEFSAQQILEQRARDSALLQDFHRQMRGVIQQAIELDAHVESETILNLRARLDELYMRCSSFGSNCGDHKENLRRLIDLVMKAVWQAAGNDPLARSELEQEEMARQQHFRMLEYPLVADMLRPDSPIEREELIPTLLSAATDELETLSWVFDPQQLQQICLDAEALLQQRQQQGYDLPQAWDRLRLMQEQCGS